MSRAEREWSDGESNPDLLNAIRSGELRIALPGQRISTLGNAAVAQYEARGNGVVRIVTAEVAAPVLAWMREQEAKVDGIIGSQVAGGAK